MISLNAGSRSTYEWLAGADKYDLVIDVISGALVKIFGSNLIKGGFEVIL